MIESGVSIIHGAMDSRDHREFKSLSKLWKYNIMIEMKIFNEVTKTWDWKSVKVLFGTRTQLFEKLAPYKGASVQYAHLKRWWKSSRDEKEGE